jgi:predicted transcriptional regulator
MRCYGDLVMMTIASNIQTQRKKLKITQEELAAKYFK